MARLLIHVEGQTEEAFVRKVLRDHLSAKGYHSVEARILGNARQTGGIRSWPAARKEIVNHLREDRGCIATTMVDYYALPQKLPLGWPGRAQSSALISAEQKGLSIHDAIRDDLAAEMGKSFDPRRFVPFVVMHEFEGLLFSDCTTFSRSLGNPELEDSFRKIRENFATQKRSMIHRSLRHLSASRLLYPATRSLSTVFVPRPRSAYRAFERNARTSMAGLSSSNLSWAEHTRSVDQSQLPQRSRRLLNRPRFTRSALIFSSGIPFSLRRDSETSPSQKSSNTAPYFLRSI
jgi:hypothetical protein